MDEMTQYNYQDPGNPQLEKDANTSKILGIVGIISALCCTFAGIILGVIGLVKANPILNAEDASEKAKSDANTGKICSIIAIAVGVLNAVAGGIMGAMGAMDAMTGMLNLLG